jgi:hypothetical protein
MAGVLPVEFVGGKDHLPVVDFRKDNPGTILVLVKGEDETGFLTFKNKNGGKEQRVQFPEWFLDKTHCQPGPFGCPGED